MSDQDRPGLPDDEPIIGGAAPPPPPRPRGAPPQPPSRAVDPWESQRLRREPPRPSVGVGGGGDGPRARYYGATQRSLRRRALTYLFVLAALAILGTLIFLLFQVLSSNGEESVAPPVATVTPAVRITDPAPGASIVVNEERAVIVRVVSGTTVVRVELLISGIVADQVFEPRSTADNTYDAVLNARFEAAGSYDLVVRAVTSEGAQIVSDAIRVVATPPVTSTPPAVITGQVVAVASLRTGPGDEYAQAGTLQPPRVVTIAGKTADRQWLRLESGLWVRRSAIELEAAALDRLPIATAPPPPTTATPPPDAEGSPTPTASVTPPPNAPDFIPSNAELIENGAVLRVTLSNVSTSPFSGAVVVRVEDAPANPAEQVVMINIDPNGSAAVNFPLDPPLTQQATVTVTIDPDDAIVESNEDNNVTEFIVVPPPEGPVLTLTLGITAGVMTVTIRNDGADLSTDDARLVVSVPGEETTRTISPLSIASGGTSTTTGISAPSTGAEITVELFIDGISVAIERIPNPNVGGGAPEEPDPEPTPTPTPGDPEEPQ